MNWEDFNVDNLKKPMNKKLIPKSQQATPNDGNLTSQASSSKTPTTKCQHLKKIHGLPEEDQPQLL